jgi:hypothetical protein
VYVFQIKDCVCAKTSKNGRNQTKWNLKGIQKLLGHQTNVKSRLRYKSFGDFKFENSNQKKVKKNELKTPQVCTLNNNAVLIYLQRSNI